MNQERINCVLTNIDVNVINFDLHTKIDNKMISRISKGKKLPLDMNFLKN